MKRWIGPSSCSCWGLRLLMENNCSFDSTVVSGTSFRQHFPFERKRKKKIESISSQFSSIFLPLAFAALVVYLWSRVCLKFVIHFIPRLKWEIDFVDDFCRRHRAIRCLTKWTYWFRKFAERHAATSVPPVCMRAAVITTHNGALGPSALHSNGRAPLNSRFYSLNRN